MFTTDSRTERFLTSLGVKYEYKNDILLPSEFTPGWNSENIGRPVAVRDDAVIEYATLMEAGSAAPAPIMCSTDRGYRVLDGVQRLSAAELNQITRVSAYIVQTDSEDSLATIRVLANPRMQGRAEPAEWTRRRAVEVLVIDRGMSPNEVAQKGGWKPADVKRIAEAIELQNRLSHHGAPELPDAMLAELRPYIEGNNFVEQATEPVVGFLQTLKKSRIAATDATPFIDGFFAPLPKSANPYTTFSDRLDEIHDDPEIRSRLTGRQATELPKDVVLLRTLKTAATVLEEITTHGTRIHNVDEFFRIVARITKQLKSLAPSYKQPQEARVPADLWSNK